jgi:hypothetical protein
MEIFVYLEKITNYLKSYDKLEVNIFLKIKTKTKILLTKLFF